MPPVNRDASGSPFSGYVQETDHPLLLRAGSRNRTQIGRVLRVSLVNQDRGRTVLVIYLTRTPFIFARAAINSQLGGDLKGRCALIGRYHRRTGIISHLGHHGAAVLVGEDELAFQAAHGFAVCDRFAGGTPATELARRCSDFPGSRVLCQSPPRRLPSRVNLSCRKIPSATATSTGATTRITRAYALRTCRLRVRGHREREQ